MSARGQAVLDAIDAAWIAATTERMVEIPSVTMDEARICEFYRDQLRALDLEVTEREVTPGRFNLYARLPGRGGGRPLTFNGHLDTIPIGKAWPPRREGDRIYGRGSEDLKGSMAALLGMVRALRAGGVALAGDLWLTAVVGHEEAEARKDGPRAMIEDINAGRLPCERIVIVEGDEQLWTMSMGSTVFTITLESDLGGAHTNNVPFGRNPIRVMGDVITAINALQEAMDAGARHPLAGAERIDLGIAQAGDYHNRTPVRCVLEGTRRWMPGKTVGDVVAELERLVAPLARSADLRHRIEIAMEREPFETPADDPAVRAVGEAAARVKGSYPPVIGRRIVGDANLYFNGARVPVFYYGPAYVTAHADVEHVSVESLARCAKVYALAAMDYCGVA